LLRDPASVATTDFTIERLVSAHNRDLANALGNRASRALTLSRRDTAWRTVAATRVGADLHFIAEQAGRRRDRPAGTDRRRRRTPGREGIETEGAAYRFRRRSLRRYHYGHISGLPGAAAGLEVRAAIPRDTLAGVTSPAW
jgi:hypothetical protein